MNKHDFDLLLQKYLAGECDEDETRQVELWSNNMLLHSELNMAPAEKRNMQERIWKRLKSDVLGYKPLWRRLHVGVAASILLAALCVMWWAQNSQTNITDTQHIDLIAGRPAVFPWKHTDVIIVKSEENAEVLTLDDGSKITLGKNSYIRYPSVFARHKRELYLEGEAFFEVARDEKRPFLVYSGGLVTRVLGTSFNIRSSTGKTEVEVVSGSVSVYENTGKPASEVKAVILTPNQRVVFEKNAKKLEPELVDTPVFVREPEDESDFIFDGEPLPQVLTKLSEAFEVAIKIESPALSPCIFTGDLNGLPLHAQLDLICKSINGSYELKGNVYMVNGEGCQEDKL